VVSVPFSSRSGAAWLRLSQEPHEDTLHSLNQAVTANCSDFLGTALRGRTFAIRISKQPIPDFIGGET
jgi:hypothetical protein